MIILISLQLDRTAFIVIFEQCNFWSNDLFCVTCCSFKTCLHFHKAHHTQTRIHLPQIHK